MGMWQGGRLSLLFLTPWSAVALAPPEHRDLSWAKGVASPPGTRPLPKHAAIEQLHHPFLWCRATAVSGLRRAGTCSPVADLFDQGIFGSASPPARRGEARRAGSAALPVCIGLPLRGRSPAPPCPGAPCFGSRRGQPWELRQRPCPHAQPLALGQVPSPDTIWGPSTEGGTGRDGD